MDAQTSVHAPMTGFGVGSRRAPTSNDNGVRPAWNDALGLSDPSFGATLSIGGLGVQAPTALHGSCTCRVSARSRGWPAAFAFGAVALLVTRRRREGAP